MENKVVSYEVLRHSLGLDLFSVKDKDIKLMNLCCALREGYTDLFEIFIKNALDAGFTIQELLDVMDTLIRDGPELKSIIEFLRILRYEETNRKEPISIVNDDIREYE